MVALRLNEASSLQNGDIIAITFKVVGLEPPMLMEVQNDSSPKAASLLLGIGNGIGANMQPSIKKHEVLLVGVRVGPGAVPGCLHRGQQVLIKLRLAIDVAC
jgi:hypothetical protein